MPQESIPVPPDPSPDGCFAQVATGFLAFDPLEPLRLFLAALVETHPSRSGESVRTVIDELHSSIETSRLRRETTPLVRRKVSQTLESGESPLVAYYLALDVYM